MPKSSGRVALALGAFLTQSLDKPAHPYPHDNHWTSILDGVMFIVAIVAPLLNIPQIYSIIVQGSSAGVSLLSWTLYAVLSGLWLLYAIAHRQKALALSSGFWILSNSAVIIVAALYA
jgi:uncharacterized protein with PQ loop repeat